MTWAMFWVSMAITAATSYVSVTQAQQNAETQLQYNKEIQDQQAKSAAEAQVADTKALNLTLIQEQNAASDEAQSIHKEGLKAKGRFLTNAGESGVSGISVDNLMGDFNRQEATYIDSLKYNTEISADVMNAQATGSHITAVNRTNAGRAAPVTRPNLYAAALGIADRGISNYQQLNNR